MSAKIVWLLVFVALYWGYCVWAGMRSAKLVHTVTDFFIAGRQLSLWLFILAATATSFSGWTFMGHPGLVYRDGFQYAYASFYAIAIPFTGVLFLKRQWMLGKRFGYLTPGEMLADYFRGDAIRLLTVLIALLFSIPYLGVQLNASGYLFNVLTDGLVGQNVGMWLLALTMLVYLTMGGLRAVAYVDALQCALMAIGIVITGAIALDAVGGWDMFRSGMAQLASDPGAMGTTQGHGGGDYNAYFAIPGVIQFTAGLGQESPVGGMWTGMMVLTYLLAMMGIQASPAFSMWAFANNNPRPFAPQQVWASSFAIGLILMFFTLFQGVGAHLLGADPEANRDPVLMARMLDGPNTRIVKAPKDSKELLALVDRGAVPLLGEDIGKDMDAATLAKVIEAGHQAAVDAEVRAKANALMILNLAPDPMAAIALAESEKDLSVHLTAEPWLAPGYEALYRVERRKTFDAAFHSEKARFIVTPLPAGPVNANPDFLVPEYFNLIVQGKEWLVGLLAICALAAMQSTGAAYISAAAGMLTRDFHKSYLRPASSHSTQKLFGRVAIGIIILLALLVSTFSHDALVLLGGLAVAFGLQMVPSLTAVTWMPWITRQGATYGLIAGVLCVLLTENLGVGVLRTLGIDLWGRWPLTIHSAGWGLGANVLVCFVVSSLTQRKEDRARRMKYHNFLREHAGLSRTKHRLVPVAWMLTLGWLFFGIGPGAVLGNDIFGAPGDGIDGWTFGIPSIWAWQILFWLLGVGMMWFLAYKMEMSTVPEHKIEALVDDVTERARSH